MTYKAMELSTPNSLCWRVGPAHGNSVGLALLLLRASFSWVLLFCFSSHDRCDKRVQGHTTPTSGTQTPKTKAQ